ncbi:MAG: hypothetical protein AAFQ66_11560, partial [Pseudomonadota bacterium]
MGVLKPVGQGAASRKYDLITALGAYALSLGKPEQRLVLRFITLLTARYNWKIDRLTTGQAEIARLWSCNTRTVKREMSKLRGLRWLRVVRQGTRGRVTEYSLDVEQIMDATQRLWPAVGPDFEERMTVTGTARSDVLVRKSKPSPPPSPDGSDWSLVQATLHTEDSSLYRAWFAAMTCVGKNDDQLVLSAPSRFHA